MTNAEVELLLQLPNIERWQIVEVSRRQSVAEHTYRVWVLTMDLYDRMFPIEHNSFRREGVAHWALVHDALEVITGDIPATVKQSLESVAPGAVQRLEEALLTDHMPSVANKYRGIKYQMEQFIVQIADITEAIMYVGKYGVDERQVREVQRNRATALGRTLRICRRALPPPEIWDRARKWVDQFCTGTEVYNVISFEESKGVCVDGPSPATRDSVDGGQSGP